MIRRLGDKNQVGDSCVKELLMKNADKALERPLVTLNWRYDRRGRQIGRIDGDVLAVFRNRASVTVG